MSEEKKNQNSGSEKLETLMKIQKAPQMYSIVSGCTKMPYVICDPDTFDDEVLLFFEQEDAQAEVKKLTDEKEPVNVMAIENRLLLTFFSSLYTMGVNCVVTDKGTEQEQRFQIREIVHRPDDTKLPDGKVRVENPELHLTALYLMQKTLRLRVRQNEEEVKELQEELMAHFGEGRYIVAFEADKGLPLLKDKNGDAYQPIFTDVMEFQRFNKEQKFKTAIVEASKLPQILIAEAKGVVLNPFGVNLQLQMKRNPEGQPEE